MKAIVTKINHPNEYLSPKIIVRVKRGKSEILDTFKNQSLYEELSVGDAVEVCRKTNSPYVYIVRN